MCAPNSTRRQMMPFLANEFTVLEIQFCEQTHTLTHSDHVSRFSIITKKEFLFVMVQGLMFCSAHTHKENVKEKEIIRKKKNCGSKFVRFVFYVWRFFFSFTKTVIFLVRRHR